MFAAAAQLVIILEENIVIMTEMAILKAGVLEIAVSLELHKTHLAENIYK